MLGVPRRVYLRAERYNLQREFAGRAGQGDKFDRRAARAAARDLVDKLDDATVLIVGKATAEAFGEQIELFAPAQKSRRP